MNPTYLIGVLALLGAATILSTNQPNYDAKSQFQQWKIKYSKVYNDKEEEIFRLGAYIQNQEKIMLLNSENTGATFAENQFMDLTQEEFEKAYLTFVPSEKLNLMGRVMIHSSSDIDWAAKGAVEPVLDQGQCGASYAISAIGNIESANYLYGTKVLEHLSIQQIIDCSTIYGNQGCNGGTVDNAFKYAVEHGVTTDEKYPFVGVQEQCKIQGGEINPKKYTDIATGDCNALSSAIQIEPISVSVDGSSFIFYEGGIFSNCAKTLNLAVLLVGKTDQYWKLQNSWGTDWGEEGYIRIASGNTCGICDSASYVSFQ